MPDLRRLAGSIFGLAIQSTLFAALGNSGLVTAGGSATITGETLRQGRWDFTLRGDDANFQTISQAGAERRAAQSGGVHAVAHCEMDGEEYYFCSDGCCEDFQEVASDLFPSRHAVAATHMVAPPPTAADQPAGQGRNRGRIARL